MGCSLEVVDKPRSLADGCRDPESIVLGVDERLEVIEDDGLRDLVDALERERLQEEAMATDPSGESSDGRRGTAQAAGELAMSASRHEPGGYGDEELGPFEIVRAREALTREPTAAGAASKPRDLVMWIIRSSIGARSAASKPPGCAMGEAVGPRAVGGHEPVRTHAVDWAAQHAPETGKRRAAAWGWKSSGFSGEGPRGASPPGTAVAACGHWSAPSSAPR